MMTDDANDKTKNSYGFMEVSSLFKGFLAKVLVYAIVVGAPAGLIYGFVFGAAAIVWVWSTRMVTVDYGESLPL